MNKNPYDVLGVSPNASYDGVWNRYNKIQKKKLEEGNKKNEQESL